MKLEKINLLMALRLLININLLLGGLLWSASGHSQDEAELASLSDAYVYEGNSHFNNSFLEAEKNYRMALSEMPSNTKGAYNLGNAYYNAELYDEALARLLEAARKGTKLEKHRAYHNIGNVLMQDKQCKKAVEAYKNALRNDPKDEESRYNLAIDQECAKEEGGGGDDDQEEKEQNQDQQQQNKDQQDQQQQNKDQQDQEKQNKNDQEKQGQQENQEQQQNQEEQQQQSQEQNEGEEEKDPMEKLMEKLKEMNIPLEKAQMILEAMRNNEIQYVQQKKKKASKRKDKSKPDW